MKQKINAKKTDINKVLTLILSLIIGGISMYLAYIFISKETLLKIYSDNDIVFLISLILSPFFAIAIHEFGHAFMGLVQGFKLQLFVVGFFGIRRNNDKIELFFNKNFQYFGGVAATSPTRHYKNIKERFAYIVLAGPLSSLILGILLLIVFYLQESILNSILAISGFISILLFFATTVPEKSGSFFSDRKRFQRLLNKGTIGKIELALLESINQNFIDNHCKNLIPNKFNLIKKAKEPNVKFWGYFFEYHYLKDNKHIEQAEYLKTKLYEFKDVFPKSMWKTFQLD